MTTDLLPAWRNVERAIVNDKLFYRLAGSYTDRDGYIADKSRHNLGVAIDLTLVKIGTQIELDMGTPHDEFSARAHTANATGAVAANRDKLVKAMTAQGFTNYDQEWWHFSFSVPNPLRFDLVIR